MVNAEEVNVQSTKQLDQLIAAVPEPEKLFIFGDFKARVETEYHTLSGSIGNHGASLHCTRTRHHKHAVLSSKLQQNNLDASQLTQWHLTDHGVYLYGQPFSHLIHIY